MGRLQTSIGLVTGTDIVGTVDKLIAISARPRDRLVARTGDLNKQQVAIAELTALVIGVQFSGNKLNAASQYEARKATSSNEAALTASATATAELGDVRARTTQLAATHVVQSKTLTSDPAADLGFVGTIRVRAGGSIQSSVSLDALNQGEGVTKGSIRITDRAGNTEDIDLSKASTIDDVINAINSASKAKVTATTVGDSIRLTDVSGSTAGNLQVGEVNGGETAADLGIRGLNVAASVATGQDIYGNITDTAPTGLQGVPLSSLGGGNGLGALTSINVTTTNGQTSTIDLSTATTTHDVIRLINESGLQVEAKLNDSGTGFRVRDLSGGSTNAFSISSTDATATRLKLDGASSGRVINGGDLLKQLVTSSTKLSSLRQGRGIDEGTIVLKDSNGQTATIDLTDAPTATVGDLITRINATSLSITAAINASGDGIVIDDNGGGTTRTSVTDTSDDTTAADLGLKTASVDTAVGNGTVQRIDAAQSDLITVSATDSLQDIVSRINEKSKFSTATIVTDNDGKRSIAFRSARGGDDGRLAISTNGFDLGLRTTAVGTDAKIEIQGTDGATRLLRSSDGVFTDVNPGLSITAKAVTEDFVNIGIARDTTTVVGNVKAFVAQYNKLVDKLSALTFFSSDSNEVGLLFGSSEALRIETSFSRLLSGSLVGAGSIRGIAELGLTFDDKGKLELSETKLTNKLASNSDAVAEFLTKENTGLVAKLSDVSDRIAGAKNSLLINRTEALGARIQKNNLQAESLKGRLDKERERLLSKYYAAEQAISNLQSNQSAISRIQFIGNYTNSSN